MLCWFINAKSLFFLVPRNNKIRLKKTHEWIRSASTADRVWRRSPWANCRPAAGAVAAAGQIIWDFIKRGLSSWGSPIMCSAHLIIIQLKLCRRRIPRVMAEQRVYFINTTSTTSTGLPLICWVGVINATYTSSAQVKQRFPFPLPFPRYEKKGRAQKKRTPIDLYSDAWQIN